MGIYIINTFLSILLAGASTNLSQNRNKYIKKWIQHPEILSRILAFLSFVPLTVVSAIRFNVGTDFAPYYRIYISQAQRYIGLNEPLFTFLVQSLNKISKNPQLFFAVSSIIICGVYFLTIYRHSDDPVLSILFFVITTEFFRSMNGIRQYLALSILFFSLSAIEKQNWKAAFFFIIVAYFMHNSALVFFALLVLCLFKIRPSFLVIGAMIGTLFLGMIVSYTLPWISRLTHFSVYFLDSSDFSESEFLETYFIIFLILSLFVLYLYYIERRSINMKVKIFTYSVFLGLGFSILTYVFPRNINRMIWYEESLLVIYFPSALKCVKDKRIREIIKWIMIVIYCVLCFRLIPQGVHDAVPYQTFWQ